MNNLPTFAISQSKIWLVISTVFIVVGLALLSIGSWQMYQYYAEIAHPPAPILKMVVAEHTATNDRLEARPTAIKLMMRQKPTHTRTPAIPTQLPTQTPTLPPPTVTPTVTPTGLPAPTIIPTPAPNRSKLTRIVAESIGLDAKIIAVGWRSWVENGLTFIVWSVADDAVGWHASSKLPGEGGNIVLSGHHNIKGEVFRYVANLETGAIITLYEGEKAFQYAVTDKFIVQDKDEPQAIRLENAKWIGEFNEERLTLVTCWPYIGNTHRVIVIAKKQE